MIVQGLWGDTLCTVSFSKDFRVVHPDREDAHYNDL